MNKYKNNYLNAAPFKPLIKKIKDFSILLCKITLKKFVQYTNTYISNQLIVYKNKICCTIKAINIPPKAHAFTIFTLNCKISSLLEKEGTPLNMLSIFDLKLKKNDVCKTKLENDKNLAGKAKHYPPANKEWFNSVYAYNKNTTKLLPIADRVMLRLVKSYFNLYSRKLENKIKSRRLRLRVRRLSTNRILVSRPELKHTNDKIIVTMYVYNRQKKYYLNKIKKIASMDQIDKFLPEREKIKLNKFNGPWPSNLKAELIKDKSLKLKSKVVKHKSML